MSFKTVAAMVLAVVTIAGSGGMAGGAWIEPPLASWENTMDHFGGGTDFDAIAFDTIDGVTYGTYSLFLDLKPGTYDGLRSAGVDGLAAEWQQFFPAIAGNTKLLLDVTSSNSYMNLEPGGHVEMFVFVQGGYGQEAEFSFTTPHLTLNSPNSWSTITETLEFDLTHTDAGELAPRIPEFGATNPGWFEMRIGYSVIGSSTAGLMFIDNLRGAGHRCGILGDFNGNGAVDIADYTTWVDHFGMSKDTLYPYSYVTAGIVGIDDYTTWVDNFGQSLFIPEPASLTLLLAGGMMLGRRTRQGIRL